MGFRPSFCRSWFPAIRAEQEHSLGNAFLKVFHFSHPEKRAILYHSGRATFLDTKANEIEISQEMSPGTGK